MTRDSKILDIDLGRREIQSINSADSVAGFFLKLGYDVGARTPQVPENLGMTAEGATRPIRNIELIADHEGLFQVYLFELSSVTVSHTRELVRAFRNLAGGGKGTGE